MNLFKKIILIFIGVFISLFFMELVLKLYPPKVLDYNIDKEDMAFFEWAYLDIHKPFFKIDGKEFYIQRSDFDSPLSINKRYQYKKNSKRIFILGESTAKYYGEQILKDKLLKYFNCEVINCGMEGYDIYRIEKISEEITKLKPDWIICFVGNNDKVIENQKIYDTPAFEPIEINYLPYKYKFIKNSMILNLLSNRFFNKEIKLKTQEEIEKFFRTNIIKIINNLKNSKIIFIDIPNNGDFCTYSGIYEIMEMEKTGSKLWKDSNHYNILLKRLEFIKSLQNKYYNVFCTNLTDILLNYCDDKLGYNVFVDECHWTKTTYELLSEIISKIIMKSDFNKEINIDISKQTFNDKLIKDRCSLSENYGSVNYFIKKDFDGLYNDYLLQIEELKKSNLTNKEIYNTICVYAYALYKNNYKPLGLNILHNLLSLQPKYPEAYLTLGLLYYKENDIKKAEEYFDIAKKFGANDKFGIKYLTNELTNSNN